MEKHKLKVFEYTAPVNIVGPKRDDTSVYFRILQN